MALFKQYNSGNNYMLGYIGPPMYIFYLKIYIITV